jgi:UDP-glucose 4-epimerase
MNILITGANGLLGQSLINKLSHQHTIYAVVRNNDKIFFKKNQNVTIIEMDLTLFDSSKFPSNIDVVYYLAQSNRFREFPDGAIDMMEINVYTPLKIAHWGSKNNVKKFIYASSGGVYTNPNKAVKEFFDINANEKMGFYLNSKLSAEMLLKNYSIFFETFVIIRPFFMYGIGQNQTMLIPRLIENIKNEKEIVLVGNTGIKINPVYITDAAEAASKILSIEGEHIINIAGNEIVSLQKLCLIMSDMIGKKAIFKHDFNAIQNDLIADTSVMKKNLFNPITPLEEGIKKIVGQN